MVVVTTSRVRHGRGMRAAGDEAGEVRHVDEQLGADLVRDLAHAGEVDGAGRRCRRR